MGNVSQAISYLSQGLQVAESSGRREEEAKIRHRLGLALCDNGQLETAYVHLDQAASLLEIIRKESTGSTDYRLSLFDLQTASYQALQVYIWPAGVVVNLWVFTFHYVKFNTFRLPECIGGDESNRRGHFDSGTK